MALGWLACSSFGPPDMLSRRLLVAAAGGGSFTVYGPIVEVGTRNGFMTGTGYKSFPGMALDTINHTARLHLVYRSGGAHNSNDAVLAYKYSDDEGATWSDPGTAQILITPSAGDDIRDPFIIVSSTGRVVIGYDYMTPWNGSPATFTVRIIYSDNGGASWSSPYTIPDTAAGNEVAGTSQPIQLNDGTLVIFGNVNDTAGGVLYSVLWKSTDDGATWGTQTDVAKNIAVREYAEPQARLLANGTIVCLLRSDNNQHTWRTVSSDDGATWSSPTDVLVASSRPDFVEYRAGRIVLFGRNNNSQFYARWTTSEDGGLTWAALQNVAGSTDLFMYGAPVVLDPGRVGIVYSLENSGSDADLYYALWSDTGA